MAITINGTGTITGISAGGLPDGIVDADMLATAAVTSAKIASGAGGQVLQVQYNSTTSTGTQLHTANTDTPHSYLTVDITPKSQTSIIYVSYHLFGEWGDNGFYDGTAFLSRRVGGTHNYLKAPTAGSRRTGLTVSGLLNYSGGGNSNNTPEPIMLMQYPDDHNQTTSTQITYFPAANVQSGYTWYYNQCVNSGDFAAMERGVSWIMAMEVTS